MYPIAFLKRLVNKCPVSKPGNIGSKREKNAPQKEKICGVLYIDVEKQRKNQRIRSKIGAISAGRNIAGTRFAVFTLVIPRMFVPTRIIMREPVTDI